MKKALAPTLSASDDSSSSSTSSTLSSWKGLDAIAVGVKFGAEAAGAPVALSSPVAQSVVEHLDIDFNLEMAQWPDFSGKAGEIIELPVSATDGISRLYLVGVGNESRDELRKSGAALGRKTKGTGLGLYLTSKIIQQHGGLLTVKDNTPNGAIFEMLLPIE